MSAPTLPYEETGFSAPPVPRRMWRRGAIAVSPVVVVVVILLIGPLLWTADPSHQVLTERLQGPSLAHPLGVDQLGRDLLARVLHGGRLSLGLSLIVTIIAGLIGTLIGMTSGMLGGFVDVVINRFIDSVITLPHLLLTIAISGLVGGGMQGLLLAIPLLSWTNSARVARSETIRLRRSSMVQSAHALGASPLRIMLVHILPATVPSLLVVGAIMFAHTILTIASLSFLGIGVRPPTPEWGSLLNDGSRFIERSPHLLIGPGLAIVISSFSVSLSADRLRRALDPRTS